MPLRLLPRSALCVVLLGTAVLAQGCLDWSSLQNGACGDGIRHPEVACDDGKRISGDGCRDTSRIDPAVCDNCRVDPGEKCEDGNALNDDACVSGCALAGCGDGYVHEFVEQCDDGSANGTDGDGCSSDCMLVMTPSGPQCGDGKLEPPEVCDDGNQSNTDSCLVGCSFAACGDGNVRTGVEECDVSNADPPNCHACMLCGGSPDQYFQSQQCPLLHRTPRRRHRASRPQSLPRRRRETCGP